MGNEKTKWWEKTVEYQFVLDNYQKFSLIAPLDGNHEKGTSDTIAGQDNKFILIEFKRDASSQQAEFAKFQKRNPDKTKDNILTEFQKCLLHKCHFIIYAQLEESRLKLYYQNYLDYLNSNSEENSYKSYDEMFEYAVGITDFLAYLDKLQQSRNGSDGKDASSSSFANVLVLDNKGNCQTITEFQQQQLEKNQQLNNKQQNTISTNTPKPKI